MTAQRAGHDTDSAVQREAGRGNIILTGFMGTGKTSVAREVAVRLGRTMVDMDEVIARRSGMSIADIFAQHGEGAFREQERALCEELAAQPDLVIATGGGALVDATNREVMGRTGLIVCLDGDPDALVARLAGDKSRPMLWGEEPAARLRELWHARQPRYAEIPWHIDTTTHTVSQVSEEVVALFRAQPTVWQVTTPLGPYHVCLGDGALAHLGALLRARDVGSNSVVVSDETVWPVHGSAILESLRRSRYKPAVVVLPAGEGHKNIQQVLQLYDRFVLAGLDRSAAVIAVGGGVITDTAGLAAATFMRGVFCVMVPTTLLGMVDAAIGGKVAVDHPKGKNLIGVFVKPLLVMLDPHVLESLPTTEVRAGLAEVIKAGIIADPELFEALEPGASEAPMRWLVERAVAVKIAVVEQDPYERGRRAVLNLGHTFAHAFELLSGYQLAHGQAVSMGLVAAAQLAERRGHCSAQTRERIVSTLKHQRLPTIYNAAPPADVLRAMSVDKKRQGATLHFVLPRAVGDVIIDGQVSAEDVLAALERMRS